MSCVVQYAALDAAGLTEMFITLICSLQLSSSPGKLVLWCASVTSSLCSCALTELQDCQSKQSGLQKHVRKYNKVFKEKENVRTGLGIDCACSYLAQPTRK